MGQNPMATQIREAIEKLRREIKGRALSPEDSNYDEARQLWNAMIDRRSAVFVQPAGGDAAHDIRSDSQPFRGFSCNLDTALMAIILAVIEVIHERDIKICSDYQSKERFVGADPSSRKS
jgi:hypothetical protein